MPLKQTNTPDGISANISELHSGKTYAHTKEKFGKERANKQAIAIALNTARKVERAFGGRTKKLHVGAINSAVPGRTDKHPMRVHNGSYVLPADVVSGMGEGNTNAGMQQAEALFGKSYVPKGRARGGAVPIVAAGGEFVASPAGVMRWYRRNGGRGTLDDAHEALDQWVMERRKANINELANLPPPAQD